MKSEFTGVQAGQFAARSRDTSRPIVLVGFLDQGNLGLGYLTSMLRAFGYRVIITDVQADPDKLIDIARAENPILIGFSLIFQFYIRKYQKSIAALRRAGIDCHITMGGHFPSLNAQGTLQEVPELDSVAQYEGELTLLELADALSAGRDWTQVGGLIRKDGDRLQSTETRHLLRDLDDLPWPVREFEPESVLGHQAMPILASRGCARTCSFCSIHTFYRTAPGKVVRTRDPAEVVKEMSWLHHEKGISIFLFQDDDFPMFGRVWTKWARQLVAELHAADLPGKIIWKLNCRADAVDRELLAEMQSAGLYLVYMGLESGDKQGLEVLDKGITVEQNLKAVATLKDMGLVFEFGFMMFDPSSTFGSVRENLKFLQTISQDGSVAAVFCRMLPYDGTPIKDRLQAEGRLKGDVCDPSYDFLDPRMDAFYEHLNEYLQLSGWIHGHKAVSPALNWAWNEVAILQGLFPELDDMDSYRRQLAQLTSQSNQVVFQLVAQLADHYEMGEKVTMDPAELGQTADLIGAQLMALRDRFIRRHETELLTSLSIRAAPVPGPVEPVQVQV